VNHITLMGRLTRDPELRHTQSGLPVASFSLAVDRRRGNAQGERQTDFIDCVAWRGTAEFVAKYFPKGRMCAVTGNLQIRTWQDKEGNNRRTAEVIVDNVYFTGDRREDAGGGGGGYNAGGSGGGYSAAGTGGGYNAGGAGGAFPAGDAMPPIDQGYNANAGGASDFTELDDDGDLPF